MFCPLHKQPGNNEAVDDDDDVEDEVEVEVTVVEDGEEDEELLLKGGKSK